MSVLQRSAGDLYWIQNTIWGFLLLWFSSSCLFHCLGGLRLPFLARRGLPVSWSEVTGGCELLSTLCSSDSLKWLHSLSSFWYSPSGFTLMLCECFCSVLLVLLSYLFPGKTEISRDTVMLPFLNCSRPSSTLSAVQKMHEIFKNWFYPTFINVNF